MDRKFDISWIQQIPSERSTAEAEAERSSAVTKSSSSSFSVPAAPDDVERRYLGILRVVRENGGTCHVIQIAEKVQYDFDEVLHAVLRLVSRQDLTIVQRDPVASDHLVRLTPKGLERLGPA